MPVLVGPSADPACYADIEPVDFAGMHPPYWRMIKDYEDSRCLSNAT